MKNLRSENGNTLVIAVLVLVLASIIGLSLMSMTMNGTKRNETREDINQATEQAEKGITHISTLFQKEIESISSPIIGSDNTTAKQTLETKLNTIFQKYSCDGTTLLSSGDSNLNYSVCLEDVSQQGNSKYLTFRSTGLADEQTQVIKSTFELNSDVKSLPDALNYAVSTHSEGNLMLNGGLSIKGNVLADGNIITSNFGYVPVIDREGSILSFDLAFDANPWKDTVYPKIDGTANNESIVKVNSNKKLFDMNVTKFGGKCKRPSKLEQYFKNLDLKVPEFLTYYDLMNYDFNKITSTTECLFNIKNPNDLPNYLTSSKHPIIESTSKQNPIDIPKIIETGKAKLSSSVIQSSYNKTKSLLNESYNASEPTQVSAIADAVLENRVNITGNYKILTTSTIAEHTLNGKFYFEEASLNLLDHALHKTDNILNGQYYFHKTKFPSVSITGGTHTLDGEFYIERAGIRKSFLGKIGNVAETFDNALLINGGTQTIKGIYYLDGDMQIYNSTVYADAVFYVDGDVQIERSQINSLNNGKLIIFATGNIIYEYASELGSNIGKKYYNEKPVELNAYLYSNNKIELHGTLSNVYLKGGLAAKQVFLSGMRGEVENKGIPSFKNNKNANAQSRLKIEYDDNVVKTFQEIANKYSSNVSYNEIVVQPLKLVSREIQ